MPSTRSNLFQRPRANFVVIALSCLTHVDNIPTQSVIDCVPVVGGQKLDVGFFDYSLFLFLCQGRDFGQSSR